MELMLTTTPGKSIVQRAEIVDDDEAVGSDSIARTEHAHSIAEMWQPNCCELFLAFPAQAKFTKLKEKLHECGP